MCRQDLARAREAMGELTLRMADIRRKAEASEAMVQEICRDIRKLDRAKGHLQITITSLRRLAMLVDAVGASEASSSSDMHLSSAHPLSDPAACFDRLKDACSNICAVVSFFTALLDESPPSCGNHFGPTSLPRLAGNCKQLSMP